MTTRAQLDMLLPAAIREQVRQAGHDPDTKSGERLVEWAKAQAEENRVPSVRELAEKSTEWNLEVQTPAQDPATIEQRITEAREQGDYMTASKLQYQVDRVRQREEQKLPTDDEREAIDEARARAAEAQERQRTAETETERIEARRQATAAFVEASNLQRAAERRMAGVGSQAPPEPYPIQPTRGLSDDQLALLEDDDRSLTDRLEAAQETGDHVVSSLLQSRIEREGAKT